MSGRESIPDVFDQIADTARRIHDEQDNLRPADPVLIDGIAVERRSADGGLAVVAQPGRISSIDIDSQKRDETPWRALLDEIRDVANEALAEAQERAMAEYREINKDFGALVSNLSILQADLRDAFDRSVGRDHGGRS